MGSSLRSAAVSVRAGAQDRSSRLPGAQPDIGPIRVLDADLVDILEPCFATAPETRPKAAALVAAAREHADAASQSWPAAAMERIAVRRAFAATPVSVIDTVLPPEVDPEVDMVGNDAACSAWLDSDGSGNLAGVLNTSLWQPCDAEIIRSDRLTYTFVASDNAEKTNFLPDRGFTTEICVWRANEKSGERCSPQFGMSGTTPVQK